MKSRIKKILKLLKKYITGVRHNLIPLPRKPEAKITPYSMFKDEEMVKCYEHFKKFFKTSVFLTTTKLTREYAIKESLANDEDKNKFYLEFGVHTGGSINFFSKHVNHIYGFDSFEGLSEDWLTHVYFPIGHLSLNKKSPKVLSNVKVRHHRRCERYRSSIARFAYIGRTRCFDDRSIRRRC